MPRKRKDEQTGKREVAGVMGLRGSVEEQPITETLVNSQDLLLYQDFPAIIFPH